VVSAWRIESASKARNGNTVYNSAIELRTLGKVRQTACPGEASSSSCNTVKLSPPARGGEGAGPLRPEADVAPKASGVRRRCFHSRWMMYCCCQSNRVAGTCDRSPCGSKTPVFNFGVGPVCRRGVLGLSLSGFALETGGCLRGETAKTSGSRWCYTSFLPRNVPAVQSTFVNTV